MSRRRVQEDDWDDEGESWKGDDDIETIPCPFCKEPIPEDTPRCPYCENYVSDEDEAAPPPRKPWWIVMGALLALYVAFRWIV